MYNNLIDDADYITTSSTRDGVITNVLKEGDGSAILQAVGAYTGTSTAQYTVEIDNVDAGYEITESTFEWEDGLGNSASDVATSTSETLLNNGVSVKFVAGAGNDFALGDKWYFKGINQYSPAKLINFDRDQRYRSDTLDDPNYILIDFGTATACTAFCLMDHNFTDSAVVKLQADSTDDSSTWVSPAFEETLTITDHYTYKFFSSSSYRYWRIEIDDETNPDTYIEVGEIFLGNYLELSMGYYYGDSNSLQSVLNSEAVISGVRRHTYFNTSRTISLNLTNPTSTDRDNIWTMYNALVSKTSNYIRPFFLFLDDILYYVTLSNIPLRSKTYNAYEITLTLTEVLTSR